jgi:RHS repeat-associated protein
MTVPNEARRTISRLGPRIAGSVDVVSGAYLGSVESFTASGPVRLEWSHHHTGSTDDRGLGPGFRHAYDRELLPTDSGLVYVDQHGLRTELPRLSADRERHQRAGLVLERVENNRYRVFQRGQPTAELVFKDLQAPARLTSLLSNTGWIKLHYRSSGAFAAVRSSAGGLLEVERAGDHVVAVAHARPGERDSEVVARYTYSPEGRLLATTDRAGRSRRYEHDAAGRLARLVDPLGHPTSLGHDAAGRCVHVCGPGGVGELRLDYYPEAGQTIVTTAEGGRWIFTYDERGVVTHVLDPCRGATEYTLDDDGRVVGEVDPAGAAWRYELDWTGAPVAKRTVGSAQTVRIDLDRDQRRGPCRRLPASHLEWQLGDLFPAPDRLPDVYAVPHEIPAPALSALRKSEGVGPQTPQVELDDLNRPVAETLPACGGGRRSCAYDGAGNVSSVEDLDGARFEYERSPAGLTTRVRGPLGAVVGCEHSREGRLAALVDPLGNRSRYVRDPLGRVVEVHRNGKLRERYVYDVAGNVVEKRGARDAALLTLRYGPGGLKTSQVLASGDTQELTYDEQGRLGEARSAAGRVELAYHARSGKRTRDLRDGLGVEHVYGPTGLRETTVLGRFNLRYEQPDHSTLVIVDPAQRTHRVRTLGFGLIRCDLDNGTRVLRQYDTAGRCLLIAVSHAAAPERAWTRRYEYSLEGALLAVLDSERGETTYVRDAARRLLAVRHPGGRVDQYAHDLAGNLVEKPGVRLGLGPGNRLASVDGLAVDHDERDHLRLGGRADRMWWYYYDSLDQLVRVKFSDGRVLEHEHDALGRRTAKRCGGEERWSFVWDGHRLAAELMPGGAVRVYVYPDDVAMVPLLWLDYASMDSNPRSGTPSYLVTDNLGCPVVAQDAEGRVVWRATIDPYGEATVLAGEGVHQPLRFPGHYFDAETGLHSCRFRAYSPKLGRFLQIDPLGVGGGTSPYALCDDPLSQVNVLGLRPSGFTSSPALELQPDAMPVVEDADPPGLAIVLTGQQATAREVDELRRAEAEAQGSIQTLRQMLNRDRASMETVEGALVELEKRWNHVSAMADDPSYIVEASREYAALRDEAAGLEEKVREQGIPLDEPPTHRLEGRPWKLFPGFSPTPQPPSAGPPPKRS